MKPSQVSEWIRAQGSKLLNVDGNRESKEFRIGARVEEFMVKVFRQFEYHRVDGNPCEEF